MAKTNDRLKDEHSLLRNEVRILAAALEELARDCDDETTRVRMRRTVSDALELHRQTGEPNSWVWLRVAQDNCPGGVSEDYW